jgi:hypothetical protein
MGKIDSEEHNGLPVDLKQYLVEMIQKKLYHNSNRPFDATSLFKFNHEMLNIMVEDPKVRIFGREKRFVEKYLHLKDLITCSY